ncbi:hypothetical protein RRG39_01695 [Mycoplasmopsis cynos]|uniref:hypothetical protein n=1 Tax=Mycoplasmopsis cynos TaxID=171284 RepID=UPI002AFFE226|nr:hypothetical protein [Mycoplasmopsis cynos]WQQ17239.1 hypothetical protein RRG39_01695 [Mycoplasmopsis cynos]
MENVTSVKDKFKILFIDGESLFNFIYTTYIHTNWENKDNSLNPLLNYLFKIIYRTPNLDNYYYSYDNFFEDSRGFVINYALWDKKTISSKILIDKLSESERMNDHFLIKLFEVFKNYKERNKDNISKDVIDWDKLFLSISNYILLFMNDIFANYSKVFIAFNWVNTPKNRTELDSNYFFDINKPTNETIRNLVLKTFSKKYQYSFQKQFFDFWNENDKDKYSALYCDLLTYLRIKNNPESKYSQWYEIARKKFIDILIEMKFDIITIPFFESFDTINSFLQMLKTETNWERRLTFLDQPNFNYQGSYYKDKNQKIPLEYFIYSQNDIFRSLIDNDVTRIKIHKKNKKDVEWFEFETPQWLINNFGVLPRDYNDFSLLTFKPFLKNNFNKKPIAGFSDKEAIKFLKTYGSIEKFEKFAFEFWENHEILTNNLKIKQPCYKKISTNFFLKCINLENKNDIHKEKFNLTRSELEYFIKVYKLIYSIKETDDLYWILYYNNSSKTENVLETEYYKYIYSNDIFLKNKFNPSYDSFDFFKKESYFNSNFNLKENVWRLLPFTSSLFKYYYNTNFENKNLNFRKYNFKHTHLMTYAPVSKLSKLFSPLNINNIYFQMFLDEIYIIDNEVFKNIVDTFSEFAKSNIYFRLLLRNLEFRKADVENKKMFLNKTKMYLLLTIMIMIN